MEMKNILGLCRKSMKRIAITKRFMILKVRNLVTNRLPKIVTWKT
jgi:hypothetical protein